MEYTIRQLADLAGVTTRTLRWYHEIGLLEPARMGENSLNAAQSLSFRLCSAKETSAGMPTLIVTIFIALL